MLEYTLRTYQSPTRLVQRLGAIQELGSEASRLGMRRPLLVTDAGVKAAGLLEVALESLRRSDVEPVVFDKVRANPGVSLVDEGAAEYRSQGCDGLVAIGGGSSIDTAKGIGVVAAHKGSIVEYEWGHSPIASRIPPMIAVPTTAGTGSEVTLWAVITDPKRKIKFNVGGTPHIASWVAVIDPELTVKLPPAVTAGTPGAPTARLLGPVMEYDHSGEPERFARMAAAFGLGVRGVSTWRAAEMAVEYVHELTRDVDIPSMQELGFGEDEIPMLADKAFADPQTIGNPRDVDAAAYRRIYKQAFDLGNKNGAR